MSDPPKSSIRLNLSSSGATTTSTASTRLATKRKRYTPVELPPYASASAAGTTVLHQQSQLNFLLHSGSWHVQAQTRLYITVKSPPQNNNDVCFALHLRGCCRLNQVRVESMKLKDNSNNAWYLEALPVQYYHGDPLEHVLIKPPTTYTIDDTTANNDNKYAFDADTQSSRGAAGMTTALRAASIASNMGELRFVVTTQQQQPASTTTTTPATAATALQQAWLALLTSDNTQNGRTVQELQAQLRQRSAAQRTARQTRIAQRLAKGQQNSFCVTLSYTIPGLQQLSNLGGLHVQHHNHVVFTTPGTVGDHQGPRTWLPCADSAAAHHRATHEMTVTVTAPVHLGISCIGGAGQDAGASAAVMHEPAVWEPALLGKELVEWFREQQQATSAPSAAPPHVIPPTTLLQDLQVTSFWCTHSWAPVPARSLGFALGPFKLLPDPEYFAAQTGDGEGIRQAYLATTAERKYLHLETASTELLSQTDFYVTPLTAAQRETIRSHDQAVVVSTAGVAHRALSLMRDVLALPTYRTVSYTQIWIPACGNEAHAFCGGGILDARLLCPVGGRLPYYAGGRDLQFWQARCAVRGWITSALPLGGRDDVGNGYLYALVESFIMSLYERGHGAQGEGLCLRGGLSRA